MSLLHDVALEFVIMKVQKNDAMDCKGLSYTIFRSIRDVRFLQHCC